MHDSIFVDTYCLARGKNIHTEYIKGELEKNQNAKYLSQECLEKDKQNILKRIGDSSYDRRFFENQKNNKEVVNMENEGVIQDNNDNVVVLDNNKKKLGLVIKIVAACLIISVIGTLSYMQIRNKKDVADSNNNMATLSPQNTVKPGETLAPSSTPTAKESKITKYRNLEYDNDTYNIWSNERHDASDKFDTLYACYIKYLKQWNGIFIENCTYTNYITFDQSEWNTIDGNVESEVVDNSDENVKLVKLTFDIKDPGTSALHEGVNIRYVYFFNRMLYDKETSNNMNDWLAGAISPDENIPQDKPKYEDVVDQNYQHEIVSSGVAYNLGLGYKDAETLSKYGIGIDRSIDIDINGDLKDDKLYMSDVVEEDGNICEFVMHVNDKTQIIEGYCLDREFKVVDIDTSDNYKEIMTYDDGVSGDPCYSFYRYDGEKIEHFDSIPFWIGEIKGDKTISVHPQVSSIQTWFAELKYMVGADGFIFEKQWYDIGEGDKYDTVTTNTDFIVYSEQSTSSKKITVKKGEQFKFISIECYRDEDGMFVSEWLKIKTADGTIAYMHDISFEKIDSGGVELNVEDIYGDWRVGAG